jgi:DNA-binding PadR family transcriptional regulator
MKGTHLGEFEEIVMLTVAALYDQAYGVAVMEEIERRTGRSVSVGALHSALERLEEKGFVQSRFGEARAERGAAGERALREAWELRSGLWAAIPKAAFGGGLS